MLLTVVNHKGGTGKTSTVVSVAAYLARAGRRVLVVDLDPQGSAALALGLAEDPAAMNMANVLTGSPALEAVQATAHGVDIIPSSLALAGMDLILADKRERETILARALAPIRPAYDVILVDCAPSLSLLTVNALTAADRYLVPLQPHYLAMHGVAQLEGFASDVRAAFGTGAEMLGIAIVAADYRQAATREAIAVLRGHYGRTVFRTEIRQSVRMIEAPSYGKPISAYAPTSPPAVQYEALTHEIQSRIRKATK